MNNIKNAIYVISKLDFNDLAVGAKPSTIKDNNSGVGLQWSVSDVNNGEIKEVSGVKILNFKTNNYKLFTSLSGMDLKNGSIQFEADILIPSMKADNKFFNVSSNTNTGFHINIKNTFRNGLEVIFGTSRVAFNFLFESNKKYNIVVSKDYNTYSLYVDGMIVGHCVSNDFNNLITVNATPTITLGAYASASTNTVDQFIGEISNVNISFGRDSNKYSNSFTKYGDHLISRLNFGNLDSASSSTVFTPGLEAVINSPMTWVYSDVTASGEYGKLNGTPFTTDIGDTGTVYFTMNTGKNVSDIDLVNFNDLYKIIYTYNVEGEPEPEVIVNDYTTSALDFENGLVDKVGTTLWTKEGTASVTDVNTIFGGTSFETKALGDGLSTTNKLITGGATPYTIEFYALIKSDNLQTSSSFHPILTSKHPNGSGGGSQGLYLNKTTNQFMYQRTTDIEPNFGVDGNLSFNNNKIAYNKINKITITFDGVALRFFINDALDYVIGTLNGHYIRTFFHLYSHPAAFDNTTKGIIDNINIFDGIATKVRNPDPYEEFLVVDLALDGENNSTKIVDNGTLKSNWSVTGNAKLSTVQRFDGFSSLYVDSGGMSRISANLSLSLINDFTISFEFIKENDVAAAFFDTRTSTSDYTNSLLITFPSININSINVYMNGLDNNWNVSLNSGTFIELNKEYKVDIICKSNNLQIYIDGILKASQQYDFDVSMDVDSRYSTIGKNINGTGGVLQCYIKNFKVYKGVAIIPEDPTGKIQLDFDNNLIDKYNNSTWTNNGVTFDQVNSVKGSAAYFNGGNSILSISNNQNLNFENKNFVLSYDFKNAIFDSVNTRYLLGNGMALAQGAFWRLFGTSSSKSGSVNLNYNSTNYSLTNTVEVENNYYNEKILRNSDTLVGFKNDVAISALNVINTFDVDFKNMSIGTASSLTSGVSYFNGYLDNFKSIKDYQEPVVIDKPAVHLPLETNVTNTGFTPLTINSVGNPTYTTVDGKKCIKFESGKYLTINSNNIFNLGTSSDFYIETEVYIPQLHVNFADPSKITNGHRLFSSNVSWNDARRCEVEISNTGFLRLMHRTSTTEQTTTQLSEQIVENIWYKIKFSRKDDVVKLWLNDNYIEYNDTKLNINFSSNDFVIGYVTQDSGTNSLDGYMSNFKMFVGTSEIPETYNDKKVLDLDFKPTGKSYLFKDNNNKCVIHPVNITQRDYQDSQYCCTFNGTNQYLQLGKNDLLNFGLDDFIIDIEFEFNNTTSSYKYLLSSATISNTENGTCGIAIDDNYKFFIYIKSAAGLFRCSSVDKLLINTYYKATIIRTNNNLKVYINDKEIELIIGSNIISDINFNTNNNTYIGKSGWDPAGIGFFNKHIYSIKVLRNTTDLSLLDEETIVYASDEKFTLTNGVEAETIEFTDIKERDVKIVTDNDKVTLKVDDNEVEIPKTTTISKIELFKDYTSQIKDVRVYDIPLLQDDDEFIGSVLIDTQYPELEVLDDGEELQVIDVGNFVIKGFIEGGVGRNYIIRNKIENFELIKGTDDYFYDGIDERYIDNYEIYEVESKQSYPLPKHVMERGVISGVVDTARCSGSSGKIKPSDMTAWCYSNKDQRLIGSYPVSVDGTYSIPNLDVHSRYDIVFKHNNRLIENISSSYRKPKRVEDIKNPRIIGIDYEYNQNSSFIKYTWQYSTNVTFSSVKLYITENPIIDNTTPFIELGNNMNHYNDYNVTHNHQYYVTIVATYEGNEYRSTQMLVNTHDRTPTVITSVGFNKTTGNVLITW